MTMKHEAEPVVSALTPPAPPPELRGRVLAAARAAASGAGRAPDLWDRLWTSRPVRLAWVAATVGLLAGHLLIGADTPATPVGPALPVAAAARNAGELAEIAALCRLTAELPGWEVAASPGRGSTRERTPS